MCGLLYNCIGDTGIKKRATGAAKEEVVLSSRYWLLKSRRAQHGRSAQDVVTRQSAGWKPKPDRKRSDHDAQTSSNRQVDGKEGCGGLELNARAEAMGLRQRGTATNECSVKVVIYAQLRDDVVELDNTDPAFGICTPCGPSRRAWDAAAEASFSRQL